MWIDEKKDTFLLRHLPFQTALLSDQAAYEQAVFEVAQSSFYHVDLFKSKKDNLQSMYVYPFINDGQLELDGISHSVSFGDCLISLNRIDEMPEDNLIMFYYTRDKQQIGNGSKEFQVSCVVSDTYTISVFAENEEEAIGLARKVPSSNWEHLVTDPDLEETVMIRMGRWGNMKARKV